MTDNDEAWARGLDTTGLCNAVATPNGINEWEYLGLVGGHHTFKHRNVNAKNWLRPGDEHRLTLTRDNS